jgi:hypothetical protein
VQSKSYEAPHYAVSTSTVLSILVLQCHEKPKFMPTHTHTHTHTHTEEEEEEGGGGGGGGEEEDYSSVCCDRSWKNKDSEPNGIPCIQSAFHFTMNIIFMLLFLGIKKQCQRILYTLHSGTAK